MQPRPAKPINRIPKQNWNRIIPQLIMVWGAFCAYFGFNLGFNLGQDTSKNFAQNNHVKNQNSNQKIQHKTNSLERLKTPKRKVDNWLNKLKLTHSKHLFASVVSVSLIAFFTFNTISNFQGSLARAKASQNQITSLLLEALQTRNPMEQSRIANQIGLQSWEMLKPVALQYNLEEQVKDLIRAGTNGLKKILIQGEELKDYRINSRGILHRFIASRVFTDDLQKLFVVIEQVRKEVEQKFFALGFLATEAIFAGIATSPMLQNMLDKVWKIYNQRDLLISILGGYGRQQAIVFTQNTGEARPAGGFTGSYIPLSLVQGAMEIQPSQSIYYPDGNKEKPTLAHPVSWYYGYYKDIVWEQGVRNGNYFPCFPSSAKYLEEEFASSRNGFANDVVVLLTPNFLLSLLPDNLSNSLEIKIGDKTVSNKSALLEEIEYATSIAPSDESNPKLEIGKIFTSLAEKLPSILEQIDLATFVQSIVGALEARDLQVWFKDSAKQTLWQSTGLAGVQTCQDQKAETDPQIITPLIANLSTDKRNLVTSNQFSIYSEPVLGGQNVKVKYTQVLPDKVDLQRPFNQFESMSFVGLQLPARAKNPMVSSVDAMKIPFLRPFYEQKVEQRYGQKGVASTDIKKLIASSQDLPSKDLGGGFVYTQPDGSRVVGVYVSDTQKTVVDFSFFVPADKIKNEAQNFNFYLQPGLNQPSLGLGRGVVEAGDDGLATGQDYFDDPQKLQAGVELKLNSAGDWLG